MAEQNYNLSQLLKEINTGKRYPALSLIANNPEVAAVVSKFQRGREPLSYDQQGNRVLSPLDITYFQEISRNRATDLNDAETMLQMLPDLELSAQVLVSSILSPQDMMTTQLGYSCPDGILPPEIRASLTDKLGEYMEANYKIEQLLPVILRQSLMTHGSYPIAVLPENSLDRAINGNSRLSMESMSESFSADGDLKSCGILGNPGQSEGTSTSFGLRFEQLSTYQPKKYEAKLSMESLDPKFKEVDTFVRVIDNPDALKIPQITQKLRESKVMSLVKTKLSQQYAAEDQSMSDRVKEFRRMSDRQLEDSLYRTGSAKYKPVATMLTQDQISRRTIGEPLVMQIPPEAVIPAFMPNNPERQVGYFILIDMEGNPIRKTKNLDHYQNMGNRATSNFSQSFSSAVLQKTKMAADGFTYSNPHHFNIASKIYTEMVETDLLARLRNGVYGGNVEIGRKEEVYRIMLSRALQQQQTQLLFLPSELMTYFCFRFDDNGVGKSILDDMKMINSLRVVLMFSNVMTAMRNAIPMTEVNLKVDEDDPDPQATIEQMIHHIQRTRTPMLPVGLSNPVDVVDHITRAGYSFVYESVPGLPDVKVSTTEKSTNYVKPDTDLEQTLRRYSIMSTGLSPEAVDATFQAEFATSLVQNNLLFSKRVAQLQQQLVPQISELIRKIAINSETLLKELTDILEANFDKLKDLVTDDVKKLLDAKKEEGTDKENETEEKQKYLKGRIIKELLQVFLRTLEATLPAPSATTIQNQLESLKSFEELLTTCVDAWVNEDFLTNTVVGDMANEVTVFKSAIKAEFLRRFMAENGILPELSEITSAGINKEEQADLWKNNQSHMDSLMSNFGEFLKGRQKSKKKTDELIQKLGGVNDTPEAGGGDTGSSGGDDFDGGFGGDEDLGGFDNPDSTTDTTAGGDSGNSGSEETTPPAGEPEATPDQPTEGEKPEDKTGSTQEGE